LISQIEPYSVHDSVKSLTEHCYFRRSIDSSYNEKNTFPPLIIFSLSESLPLLIILPAVIGGIILTMFAILVMVMCRRSRLALAQGGKAFAAVSEKAYSTTNTTTSTAATSSSAKQQRHHHHIRVPTATNSDHHEHHQKASLLGGLTPASASEDWEEDSLDGQFGRSNGNNRARIVTGFGDFSTVRIQILQRYIKIVTII
jgi:hypothetical protein